MQTQGGFAYGDLERMPFDDYDRLFTRVMPEVFRLLKESARNGD